MIIERKEMEELKKSKKWILLYGRRKTGKTFLVEKFLTYDEFFFIKRDRSILSKRDGKTIDYDAFLAITERALKEGKTAVVDEFHRLGEDFLDFIHYVEKSGKLILISSTLFLSKKLLNSRSPILGYFAEFPLPIISLEDSVKALKGLIPDKKELLETAILMREPISIGYFDEKEKARSITAAIIKHSVRTIPALMGEIFIEEERELSRVYEGVLRAIAGGKSISTEISSYLFSRRLMDKDDPSTIQQYLENLTKFGIIKRIKAYGKNRYLYKHVSPLARIFYYADEKYNVSERELSEKELERIVNEVMPLIVEDEVREFLAKQYGLEESVVQGADFDIDVCLLRFKNPEILVEVKWGKEIEEERIFEQMKRVDAKERLIFVPDKTRLKVKRLKSIDILDFV